MRVEILADALGAQGLEYLKQKFAAFRQQPRSEPAPGNRRILGWGLDGPLYARNIEADSRERAVSRALADIADAQGDADSYMAQYSSEQRRHPPIAAEIAQRLLAAGRTDEALKIANAAKPGRMDWPDFDLDDVKIAIHETAGNKEAAQAVRWSCFERFLSVEYLRDYVKALPDFEDVAALDRAMKHAEGFRDAHFALQFFLDWPNLDAAANLVLNKTKEFDGRHYEVLTAGARMLAGDHPLAASMLLRAMIDFALKSKRTSRYKHIGKHFAECGVLSESIENFGQYPNHVTYSLQLRKDHGQKRSFWDAVP